MSFEGGARGARVSGMREIWKRGEWRRFVVKSDISLINGECYQFARLSSFP